MKKSRRPSTPPVRCSAGSSARRHGRAVQSVPLIDERRDRPQCVTLSRSPARPRRSAIPPGACSIKPACRMPQTRGEQARYIFALVRFTAHGLVLEYPAPGIDPHLLPAPLDMPAHGSCNPHRQPKGVASRHPPPALERLCVLQNRSRDHHSRNPPQQVRRRGNPEISCQSG